MKKLLTLFIALLIVGIANATIKSKEKAFSLRDGRTLYIAKNELNKTGVIDQNNNIVVPFDYIGAISISNDKNTFFVMISRSGKGLEVFNVQGQKAIDSSKGYDNLYQAEYGYIISTSKGIGLLDCYLNEAIKPIHHNLEFIPWGNYVLIATTEKEGLIWDITGTLLDNDWKSYVINAKGKAIRLNNVYKTNGVDRPTIDNDKDLYSIWFYSLLSKPQTTGSQFDMPGFYYVIENRGKYSNPFPMFNNTYIPKNFFRKNITSSKIVITGTDDPNFTISLTNLKLPIIEFKKSTDIIKFIPQKFSDSTKMEYLVEQAKTGKIPSIIESNYDNYWLEDFKQVINSVIAQ